MIGRLSATDHRVPGAVCPWCGKEGDAATGVDTDATPDPGDYAVCIYCGSVNTYTADLQLARCPDPVWQAEPEPIPSQLREARRMILIINSTRPQDG